MRIKYFLSRLIKKMSPNYIKNSWVDSTSKVESGSLFYNSQMGKYSFCGYDCEISFTVIGCFTSIANNVIIGGSTHPMNWLGMSPVFYSGRDSIRKKFTEYPLANPKNTIVGNDVWIGHSAIIIAGVEIGDGAVIGAGSIVTKDVEAYSVVAGNPARLIRYRFEKELREKLLASAWWNLEEKVLQELSVSIRDPEMFLSNLEKMK